MLTKASDRDDMVTMCGGVTLTSRQRRSHEESSEAGGASRHVCALESGRGDSPDLSAESRVVQLGRRWGACNGCGR